MKRSGFFGFSPQGRLQPDYYRVPYGDIAEQVLNDRITNHEILNTKPKAPSPSVVSKNLLGHHFKLQVRLSNLLLILIITFQLRSEMELVCCPVKYLHKRFGWSFIKNDVISTKPYRPTNYRCAYK
jgi:hypothetical protein